jgi:hypothetical protein
MVKEGRVCKEGTRVQHKRSLVHHESQDSSGRSGRAGILRDVSSSGVRAQR